MAGRGHRHLDDDDFFTAVNAAAASGEAALRRAFRLDVAELRRNVDLVDLVKAIEGASTEDAVAALLPEDADLSRVREGWVDAYERGGTAAARDLAAALSGSRRRPAVASVKVERRPLLAKGRIRVSFNKTNSRSTTYAANESAKRVTQILETMRDAIRAEVSLAFTEGFPPRELARRLIDLDLGLDSRRAGAVRKFEETLQDIVDAGKLTPEKLAARVEKYAEAQLRQRALLIARTETISAANAGSRELWHQAEEAGLIDRETTLQEWVATPDERLDPICEDLDGKRVKLGEKFETMTGERVDGPPGPHPGCRCSTVLVV